MPDSVPVWRGAEPLANTGYIYAGVKATGITEPGLWFASTPEAVAEMRRVIAEALDPILDPEDCVDATFAAVRALGFTDDA